MESSPSVAFSSMWLGLDNAIRVRDKKQVVYKKKKKKVIRDGAKSYVATWNLIG